MTMDGSKFDLVFVLFTIGISCFLNVGLSADDEGMTWREGLESESYDRRTAGKFENYVELLQTTEDSRQVQVRIRSDGVWVRETASWETNKGDSLPDYVLREATDRTSFVAAVFDGRGRIRECLVDSDVNTIEEFVLNFNEDDIPCEDIPMEKDKLNGDEEESISKQNSGLIINLFPVSLNSTLLSSRRYQCHKFSNFRIPTRFLNTETMVNDCQRFLASSDSSPNHLNHRNNSFSHHHHHQPSHRRSRRSILYPGTLWCGAGNNARSEYALGEHTFTDRCCRAHDLCPKDMQIAPFKTKYYLTNKKMFTLSHCACDKRFHKCLRQVRSPVSFAVGNWYFNILHSKCFVIRRKKQCVEKGWWGKCEKEEKKYTALLRDPQAFPKGLDKNRKGGYKKRKESKNS